MKTFKVEINEYPKWSYLMYGDEKHSMCLICSSKPQVVEALKKLDEVIDNSWKYEDLQ